jgi:hypothetical protein
MIHRWRFKNAVVVTVGLGTIIALLIGWQLGWWDPLIDLVEGR